jgi:hypothetical protein
MAERPITNAEIADVLDRVADLLEAQEANRYRVRAYRTAAEAIRQHDTPLAQILREGGVEAVDALPTIGPTIAAHVAELVHRRDLTLLERLEGEVSPERLLATVPGIGPELGARIHQDLSTTRSKSWRWRPTTGACAASTGSDRGASTRRAGLGSRSSTPSGTAGTSRPSSPTRRAPTSSGKRRTGSLSSIRATATRDSAPS